MIDEFQRIQKQDPYHSLKALIVSSIESNCSAGSIGKGIPGVISSDINPTKTQRIRRNRVHGSKSEPEPLIYTIPNVNSERKGCERNGGGV